MGVILFKTPLNFFNFIDLKPRYGISSIANPFNQCILARYRRFSKTSFLCVRACLCACVRVCVCVCVRACMHVGARARVCVLRAKKIKESHPIEYEILRFGLLCNITLNFNDNTKFGSKIKKFDTFPGGSSNRKSNRKNRE